MITMNELAALAGISQTSISLIFNGKADGKISLEKQQFVRELALKYHYRPNAAAQNLRKGKQYMIGIVMPTPRSLFYADMVSLLQKNLVSCGYLALFSFFTALDDIEYAFDVVLRHNVDGIIAWEDNETVQKSGIPMAVYDKQCGNFDTVSLDFEDAAYQITQHVIALNRKKIGYIGSLSDFRSSKLIEEIEKNNIICHPDWFIEESATYDGGYNAFQQLLNLNELPEVIVAHDDTMAIGAMACAAQHRISIPEKCAIIGFDNSRETNFTNPPLSTFDPNKEAIANTLIRLLLERLKNPNKEFQYIKIKPQLIIRNSSQKKEKK